MKDLNNLHSTYESKKLQAMFETIIACIIIIDEKGIITKINPAGAEFFGYQKSELIGKNVNILMPSRDKTHHNHHLDNYHKTGITKVIGINRDIQAQKKDGTIFLCQLSVNEFQVDNVSYYAGVLHDLSHREETAKKIIKLNEKLKDKIKMTADDLSSVVKELLETNQKLEKEIAEREKVEQALRVSEQEIRSALRKEKELNDLKSRFVSMASHEFRTPLSTIQSSAGLIQKYVENDTPEKTTKHFRRIDSSIKNLTDILNDFLSISKLEEGKIAIAPERFSLQTFFADFNEELKSFLKKGQTVEMKLPEEDVDVMLDKKVIHQVLLNLFSNAVKYSEEGQTIFLFIEVDRGQMILKVKDEGIGIPHSEQRYLFERFFRGSNAINIKGTGLGLNIVKQYIDMMNGSIYFESEQGLGTTFTVVLPLSE